MEVLKSIREHPLRYAVPWSMTLARPLIGAAAVRETRQDNWGKAVLLFATASATDLEGTPARFLNATSTAGAIADPIADGMLRAESIVALAPKMPLTTGIVAAAELYNLKQNAAVQKGREEPCVPMEAKVGTVVQAIGVAWATDGIRRKNTLHQTGGKIVMLAGTGLRVHAYRKERRKIKL